MKHRKLFCILLAVILLLGISSQVLATGLSVFQDLIKNPAASFSDVPSSQWYYEDVMLARSSGLINGRTDDLFVPLANMLLCEVVAVAVRTYELYYDIPSPEASPANDLPAPVYGTAYTGLVSSSPIEFDDDPSDSYWYDTYIERATSYGLLPSEWTDYNSPATRAQTAEILYRVLPKSELTEINNVSSIPDVSSTHENYTAILTLYQAGILTGQDQYGFFYPSNQIRRCEVAAILMRLVLPGQRQQYTLTPYYRSDSIHYGLSGAGRDLDAWRIGTGDNVLMLSFALHGYEDHWNADGQELVWLADTLKAELEKNYDLIRDNNWTVYILRCVNPDGIYDGYTNNGPGRCTTHYINSSGKTVSGKGIDLNRSFPVGFTSLTSSRNFTSTSPLAAIEARSVQNFVTTYQSSTGKNVFIDVHGWTQQIITSSSTSGKLAMLFRSQFSQNSPSRLAKKGYLTDWTASLGFDSCLFEFPRSVYSHSSFVSSGYPSKFVTTIENLLRTY